MENEIKRCVILSASPISNYDFLKTIIKENDFIICADGGVFHAKNLSITPDLIVGDFDSGSDKVFKNVETIKYNPQKDYTDTHLAFEQGLKLGLKDFVLLGATGGRMDHTFANVSTMECFKNKGCNVKVIDEQNILTMIKNEKICLENTTDYKFSVFPWGACAKGVSIKNAQYPLENYEMSTDMPLGVSNEFIGKDVEIEVKQGTLLIFLSKD